MNKKEIYVHVGMPKTGTTFLQEFVFKSFENIFYFDISNPKYSYIFQDLFVKNLTVYGIDRIKQDIIDLLEQVSEKKILISDEAWFGSTLGGSHLNFSNNFYLTQILKDIFPEARIILTIRRQDKWLESMYRHLLRDGFYLNIKDYLNYSRKEFHDYISYFRKGPNIDIKVLDFISYIDNYVKYFGENNVLILPQELLFENGINFTNKLSSFLNSDFIGDISNNTKKSNSGYLYLGAMFARFLNRFFIFPGKDGGVFHIPTIKYLDYRKYLKLLDQIIPIKKSFLTTHMRLKIMEYHSFNNKEVDVKYKLDLKKYNYYE